MDFNVPWNIRLSYDYNFRQNLVNNEFQQITRQSIRMSGNLELTQKWQLTFNTGYDFDLKEFVQTSLGVYRDLGCWELSGNWVPFGRFTSYTVDIQIKASALRDLKLSRRRSFFDN
jgi:lipopolysaccharide assembly outer membrane protein LptD (OstA)